MELTFSIVILFLFIFNFFFVLVFFGVFFPFFLFGFFFVSLERKERCSVLNVKVYKLLCYNKTKCVHKGTGWSSLKETAFISYVELAVVSWHFWGHFVSISVVQCSLVVVWTEPVHVVPTISVPVKCFLW